MSDTPLLDRAVIDDLFEHIGLEAARPVFALLLEESRTLTERIVSARADAAGRENVRRAAHSLKSGSGQLGAAALSHAALKVEQAAAADSADLPACIAALTQCAAQTQAALAELLAEPA